MHSHQSFQMLILHLSGRAYCTHSIFLKRDMFLFKVILMPVKGINISSSPEEIIILNPQKAGNGHFSCIPSPADTWQKGGSASKIVQVKICMLRLST